MIVRMFITFVLCSSASLHAMLPSDKEKQVATAQSRDQSFQDGLSSMSNILSHAPRLDSEDQQVFMKAFSVCAKRNKDNVSSLLLTLKKGIDESQKYAGGILASARPQVTIDLSDSAPDENADTAPVVSQDNLHQVCANSSISVEDNKCVDLRPMQRRVGVLDTISEVNILPDSLVRFAPSAREYKQPLAVRKPFVVKNIQLARRVADDSVAARVSSSDQSSQSTDAMVKLGATLLQALMQNLEQADKQNAQQEETLSQSISKQKAYGTTLLTTILGIVSTLLVHYLNAQKC
jgi:hypothetical protein